LHGNGRQRGEEFAGNDRSSNESSEDYENDEVEDGISDDSSLPKLRLLERIDRRSDLTATTVSK
jgi:hypothetical protein